MTAQAAGTSTISASLGTVASSATVTVTQSRLVSISVSSPNPSLALGLTMELSASGNFADGSTQDFTRTVTWSSSQPSVATISSTGVTTSRTQGTTTLTATLSTFSGSANLSVSAPTLVSAVISPGSAFLPPGTSQQLTVLGSYSDGSSQNITSSASWGSSASNVATVSSSGLVTAVNTGTAAISVSASGLTFLANINVTAPGPPVITASVSPTLNAAGWNDSPVTVSFTCTPGSAPITSCPTPQVVSSEGMNQLVTGTVTDSSGNSASTTVTLSIDETPPLLTVTSPTDGATISTSTVSATGSLSDGLSQVSSLTCNGIPVTFTGSSFSCNISLKPGVNLIAVQATDTAGNVALAKMHVTYPVYPAPTSVTITPTNVNLAVGQTQQFTATDDQGRPRPDATWSLPRRTTLATITTGGSPVLTADAVGQVTLTATVQGKTAQTAVDIVTNVGSSSWTVPPLPGLVAGDTGSGHFVPATPSSDGAGLYSTEAGSNGSGGVTYVLRALTIDGRQLWQQPLSTVVGPDLYGGLLVGWTPSAGMADLDGQTGSPLWISNFAGSGSPVAVRTDGNAVGLGLDAQQLQQPPPHPPISIFVVNGATGQTTQIPMPERSISVTATTGNCGSIGVQSIPSDAFISNAVTTDADGNAYFEYVVRNTNATAVNQTTPDLRCVQTAFSETVKDRLVLMTIFADGSTSTTQLATRTYNQVGAGGAQSSWSGSSLSPGSAIPDGHGGVLATWSELFVDLPSSYMVSHISPNGQSDFHLAALDNMSSLFSSNSWPGVLGDGGTGFVTSAPGTRDSVSSTIVAFDTNSGQQAWAVQPGFFVDQMFAQDGGGVIAHGFDVSNNPMMVSVDSSGNITPVPISGSLLTDSWTGQWFSVGPGVSAINLPLAVDAASFWPEVQGNPSQSRFGVPGCPCLVQSTSNTSSPTTSSAQPRADDPVSHTTTETLPSDEVPLTAQISAPTDCPICNLISPSCLPPTGGNLSTYLLIVGDPGRNNGPGHNWNVGNEFGLAAQQQANDLQSQGHKVIACRATTVQDFNNALTGHGLIDGGVAYFGHAGRFSISGTLYSALFVGQDPVSNENLYSGNVSLLSNAQLGSNATITLNGCDTGTDVSGGDSIGQLIWNQLKRVVFGYKTGLYFSPLDAAHETMFVRQVGPSDLPTYMVPLGKPGDKPLPRRFPPL